VPRDPDPSATLATILVELRELRREVAALRTPTGDATRLVDAAELARELG
jgi:hypothetical protein